MVIEENLVYNKTGIIRTTWTFYPTRHLDTYNATLPITIRPVGAFSIMLFWEDMHYKSKVQAYQPPLLKSGEYNPSISFVTTRIVPSSDVSPLRCFSPSGGLIISGKILFLADVVDILHHWTMVVIGTVAMLFVGPYNCSRIIGAVKVEGTG